MFSSIQFNRLLLLFHDFQLTVLNGFLILRFFSKYALLFRTINQFKSGEAIAYPEMHTKAKAKGQRKPFISKIVGFVCDITSKKSEYGLCVCVAFIISHMGDECSLS